MRPVRKRKLVDAVVVSGMCRSGEPAGSSRWTPRPTTTNRVAPDRPASNNASGRSARPACATAIGVFTSCCGVKAGAINPEEDAAHLSRVRPAIAQQDAQATGQGEAARGPASGNATERDLGDGFRARPTRDRPEAPRSDGRRYVLALLTGAGAALHLPGRRCRGDAWRGSADKWDSRRRSASIKGTEFVSRDLDLWAYQRGVTLDFCDQASRPTMPSSKRSTDASGPSA